MRVALIGWTQAMTSQLEEESDYKWSADEDCYDDSSTLIEFAGRQCYESWSKPNPVTASNRGYLGNIIHQKHFSVLEHGSATFRVSDVSRSLTHELVRHRHMSFSQVSQRYVKVDESGYVVPPLWEDERTSSTGQALEAHWRTSVELYDRLVAEWLPVQLQAGVDPHRARKVVREAARCVLPNMTPTAIVVTGNHRTWREFLEKRGSIHADAEIRKLAITIYQQVSELEPNVYQDFSLIRDIHTDELVVARSDV